MKFRKIIITTIVSLLICFSGSFFSSVASGSTGASFGAIQNLSNNGGGNSTAPVVAAVGSHVYVAWEEKPAINKHIETFFVTSSDEGSTWGAIIAFSNMNGGATPQTSAVQIAAEGSYVFLTWEQGGQTAYAISSNYGATFPQNGTFTVSSSQVGSMSGEAVAASGPYVYFSWADSLTTGGKVILFVQGHDGGGGVFAFTIPKAVSTGKTSGEDEIGSGGNNVYVIWDSIYVVVSQNNGLTFTSPKQLSTGSSGGSAGREPMIAVCGSNVYVTFLSRLSSTSPYIAYVAVSNNGGTTWVSAKALSTVLSTIREVQVNCNGNNVYVTSRGKSATVTGTQQYVYVSNDTGATFSQPILLGPKLPDPENGFGGVAVSGNDVFVSWVHNNQSKGVQQVFFSASEDNGSSWAPNQQVSNSQTGVVGYGDPIGGQGPLIAAIPNLVYLVWEDNSTGNSQIMFTSGLV